MKKVLVLILALLVAMTTYSKDVLTVYTYESMAWIEKSVIKEFEKANNCSVKVVKLTDAGKIAARIKMEAKNPKGDIVLGLNQTLAIKAKEEGLLTPYKPKNSANIVSKDMIYDEKYYTTPFDYGALAFVYNKEKIKTKLTSFEELLKMEKKIVIQDPRISSTGQDFLLWTIAVYGDKWPEFWKKFKGSVLTATPGWSESFAKFETGEADIMVSYATDGAYSYENYKSFKYGAFIPKEGGFIQLEGAGIIKGSKKIELSKKFMEFLLSDKFQKEIPLNQWMFPVTKVKMPESFKYAVKADKILKLNPAYVSKNLSKWLEQWEKIMY